MTSNPQIRSTRTLARFRAWITLWTKVLIAEILCSTCADIV